MGDIELQVFANRLKELRKEKNLTQKEFAEKIGVTSAALSAYENNLKNPSIAVAKRIGEEFNVSINWLCGLTDRKSANKIFDTYTDIIDIFFDIMNIGGLNVYPTENYCEDYSGYKQTMWGISFTDSYLKEFLEDWKKMRGLYVSGTIDKEVYTLWTEKTIRKYNFPIKPETIEK